MNVINGWKTYLVSYLSLAVGIAELLGIDVVPGVDASNAVTMIQVAITAIFMRHGISTGA